MISEPLCEASNIFGVEVTPLPLSCQELIDSTPALSQVASDSLRYGPVIRQHHPRKGTVLNSLDLHRPAKDITESVEGLGQSMVQIDVCDSGGW